MTIESAGAGAWVAIATITIVTIITRWGGVYIRGLFSISSSTERFIQAMSCSVLVAIITPIAIAGDSGARVSLLVTVCAVLVLNKPLAAIALGIAAAAWVRHF